MKKEKKKIEFEKYTVKEKLLISCLTGFTASFILFLFGPIDIYANNMQEFPFTFKDIAMPIVALYLVVAVAISAILMLFQRFALNIISSLPFSMIIAGTLDNMLSKKPMMNSGDVSDLSNFDYYKMVFIFIVVFFSLLYLSVFVTKKWKNIVIFLSVLIIGMNSASLVTDFVNKDLLHDNDINCEYVLSQKGLSTVSDKENIIYILFDRFDNTYIDMVLDKYPTFFDDLEGFTYFDSATSVYTRTFPAGCNMISGIDFLANRSPQDYLNNAYHESEFLKDLKNNGYNINIFGHRYYLYTDAKSFLKVADNTDKVSSYKINTKDTLKYLSNLSFGRIFKLYMSHFMYANGNDGLSSRLSTVKCNDELFVDDDAWLSDYYKENKLTSNGNNKQYTFIYMHGSHSPFKLDENGDLSENANAISQTVGSFKTVKLYLEYLKELGVYDNSTIIISGDHGIPHGEFSPLHEQIEEGVTDAIFIKPRNAKNEKLKVSSAEVSVADIIPTIVKDAGLKTDKNYGESVFDIPEGKNRTRVFYQSVYNLDSHRVGLNKYEINGDAHDINNWELTEEIRSEYQWY